MSTTVDNRVVEMRFNNKDFEKNVQASLTSINKLNSSLKTLDTVPTGLTKISAEAKKVDFEGMGSAIETVKSKFSALEIVAITALVNITNKAMNAGQQLIKSLSLDQIAAGFQKYQNKTDAVQTIMAATASQFSDTGKQMEYVEEHLEKLNWYTDETSYNFVDMVSNIGKFTSNNVALDKAATAMQGIANWAAISGAKSGEASRAMYNLSQALSMGKLTIMDWKSIELANMATTEFKQTAIDTAVEMGRLQRGADGVARTMKGDVVTASKGFRDSLQQGWIDADVLISTLSKYGSFTNALYDATDATGIFASEMLQYIEEYKAGTLDIQELSEETGVSASILSHHLEILGDDAMDFGRKAFKAAQEAKTFEDALNYTKDAVSSVWMNTFDLIFGNFQESKNLWTAVANEMYEIFVKSGEERNKLLATWKKAGGRDDLFAGLANIWNSLKAIIEPVKEAFREIFPPKTAFDLFVITRRFREFTETLKPSQAVIDAIKNSFTVLFRIVRVVGDVFKTVLQVIKPFTVVLKVAGIALIQILGTLGTALSNIGNAISNTLGTKFSATGNTFTTVAMNIARVISIVILMFSRLISKAVELIGKLPILEYIATAVRVVFLTLAGAIAAVVNAFKKISQFKISSIPSILKKIQTAVGNLFKEIRKIEVIDKIFVKIEKFLNFVVPKVKAVATVVITAIKNIANGIREGLINAFELLTNAFEKVKNFFSELLDGKSLIEFFKDLAKNVREGEGVFGNFIQKIREFTSEVGAGQIAALVFAGAFLVLLTNISKAIQAFTYLSGSLKTMVDTVTQMFKLFWKPKTIIMEFAKGIVMMAIALKLVSSIPEDRLNQVVGALLALIGAFAGVTIIVGLLSKFVKAVDPVKLAAFFSGMQYFSLGVLALTAALALLSLPGIDAGWENLLKVLAIMGVMAAIGVAMSKFKVVLGAGSIFFVAFAAGVAILVASLHSLNGLDLSDVEGKVAILLSAMLGLALVGAAFGTIRIGSLVGIFAIGWLIKSVLPDIFNNISNLNLGKFLYYLDQFKGTIVLLTLVIGIVVSGLVVALGWFSSQQHKMALGLISLAITIAMLKNVAISLGKANFSVGGLIKVGSFIAGLIVILGFFAVLAKTNSGDGMIKMSILLGSVVGCITMLSVLSFVLGKVNGGDLAQGLGVVFVLSGIMAGLMFASKFTSGVKIAPLIVIVAGIVGLMAELAALSMTDTGQIIGAALGMAIVLGSLVAVMASMKLVTEQGANMVKDGALLFSLIATLIAVSISLRTLSEIPWQSLVASAASMAVAMIGIGVGFSIMANIAKTADPKNVLLLAATLSVMIGAIYLMTAIPIEQALAGAGALSAIMIALGIMTKLMGGMTFDIGMIANLGVAIGGMIAIAMVLSMLAPVMQSLTAIPWETLGKAAAMIIILGGSLALLSLIPWGRLLAAGGAMALISAGLWLISIALGNMAAVDWATIGQAVVMIAALGVVLGILGVIGPNVLIASVALIIAAYAIQGFATGISLMADALTKMQPVIGGMLGVAGGLLALGVAGLVATIGVAGAMGMALAMLMLSGGLLVISLIDIAGIANNLMMLSLGMMNFGMAMSATTVQIAAGCTQISMGLMMFGMTITVAAIQIESGMERIVKALEDGDKKIEESFKDTIVNATAGLLEGFLENEENIKEVGTKVGESILTGFREAVGEASPWTKMIESMRMLWEGIKAGAAQVFGPILELFHGLGEKIINFFKNLFSGIGQSMSGLLEMGDMLEGVTNQADGLYSSVGDLQRRFNLLTGSASEAKTEMVFMDGEFVAVQSSAQEAKEEVNDFSKVLDGISGAGGGGGGGSAGQAKNALSELAQTIKGQIDIFSEFNKKTEISGKKMLENMRSQVSGIKEWANNLRTLADRGINQGLLQQLANLGPQGYEKVAAFVQMTDAELSEAGALFAESLALPDAAAAHILRSFSICGANASQGFINGFDREGIYAATYEGGQYGEQGVRDSLGMQSPSVVMMTLGIFSMQGFANGIKIGMVFVRHQLLLLANIVKHESYQIGVMIPLSVARGINDRKAEAINAAVNMALEALEAAKTALIMHSPSVRVRKEIGWNFSRGFALGISDKKDEVTGSVNDLSDALINSMYTSMARINDIINGGIDINPVITPKLDLSYLENNIGQVDSMFENRRFAAHVKAEQADTSAEKGQTFNFTQNNYSPKALTRLEIYRQTNNQFSSLRRRVQLG